MEIAIFGSKRRLKTHIIPAGKGCEGLKSFADALASTTAVPKRRVRMSESQVRTFLPNCALSGGEMNRTFRCLWVEHMQRWQSPSGRRLIGHRKR